MQCPSCRFENMPGLESCGRCGTSMRLNTAVINTSPPRASRTAKRIRKIVPRRLVYEARDVAARTRRAVAGSIVEGSHVPLPEPAILRRLIVPGWAHIHSGLVLRGRAFFGAYGPSLLLGLSLWGTPEGSILLGMAFSVHASSVIDILIRQGTVRFPRMLATAAVVSLALAAFYYPAGEVLLRVAQPVEFAMDAPPFQRLDVVLVNRWAYRVGTPRRGDVILYSPLSSSRLRPADYAFAHVRFAFAENQLIDRLVGVPGDRVVWDRGQLVINGTAVPWKPLLPQRLPARLDITVPEDRYLILPTTSVAATLDAGSTSFWKDAGSLPASEVLGRAYLRSNPWSRLWFIR